MVHDESETSNDSYDETAAEEEMEKMLLAQEGEVGDVDEIDNNGNVNGNNRYVKRVVFLESQFLEVLRACLLSLTEFCQF